MATQCQSYRFGASESEHQKYVLLADRKFFEEKVDFRVVDMEAPVTA